MAVRHSLWPAVRRRVVVIDAGRLEALVNHRFADAELLRTALTHPSAVSGRGAESYERLEFLGDRVLALVVAEMLLAAFPLESEGGLARRLVALVRRETVIEVAEEVGLGDFLVLGPLRPGDAATQVALGDGCEALIGALYLDGGLEAAKAFVTRYWRPRLLALIEAPLDAKTALQEWAQGRGMPLPHYGVVRQEGAAHRPTFTVRARVGDREATGSGPSRRAAEQIAAASLLEMVGAA
jgi:ribonuclease III